MNTQRYDLSRPGRLLAIACLLTSLVAPLTAQAQTQAQTQTRGMTHEARDTMNARTAEASVAQRHRLTPLRAAVARLQLEDTDDTNDTSDDARPTKASNLSGTINVNTADVAQLVLLPGVGPAIAQRLVDYREKRPFSDVLHVLRVKGIGRKTFQKMRPFLSVEGATTLRRGGEPRD